MVFLWFKAIRSRNDLFLMTCRCHSNNDFFYYSQVPKTFTDVFQHVYVMYIFYILHLNFLWESNDGEKKPGYLPLFVFFIFSFFYFCPGHFWLNLNLHNHVKSVLLSFQL